MFTDLNRILNILILALISLIMVAALIFLVKVPDRQHPYKKGADIHDRYNPYGKWEKIYNK